MAWKWLGAILILSASGCFGFCLGAQQRREAAMLRGLCHSLKYLQWELRFRLTALPELLRLAANQAGRYVSAVFRETADELESWAYPDANSCLSAVLTRHEELPPSVSGAMKLLGASLGRFDLDGQLDGLREVGELAAENLKLLEQDRQQNQRAYRILGLCAGAGLAVILL